MKTVIAVLLFLSTIYLGGCDQEKVGAASKPSDQSVAEAKVIKSSPVDYQRFIPVSTPAALGSLAIDTKTGQLCKTWNWTSTASGMSAIGSSAPLCKSLYEEDKKAAKELDPFTQFGGKAVETK